MSYDKPLTNYRVKDDLRVGDPAKRVLGGELSNEFEAIARAITDIESNVQLPNIDSDINWCGALDATSSFEYPGGLRSVQGGDIYLTTTAGNAAPEWIGLDGAELNVGNAIGFSAVEGRWYLIGDIAGVEGQEGPQGEQGEQGEKGDDGEPGADGKDGADGEKGDKGDKGEDGKDADSVEGFLKGVDEYEAPRDVPTNMVSWTTDDSYNTKSGVFNIRYEKKSFAPDYFVTFYGHFAQSNLTMGVHCEDDYGYSTQLAGPYGLAVTIASSQAQFLTPEIALGGDYGYCEDKNAAVKLKRDGPSTFKHAVQAADFLDADGNSIIGAGGGGSLWTDEGNETISYTGTVTVSGNLIAAKSDAGEFAFAAGSSAGYANQGAYSVAVGISAGHTNQGMAGVAVGPSAGGQNQGDYCVAIGYRAGITSQSEESIAIGTEAGETNQGRKSLAIGYRAGKEKSGSSLKGLGAGSIHIKGGSTSAYNVMPATKDAMVFNTETGSLVYNGTNKWTFDGGPVQATGFLDADGDRLPSSDTVQKFTTFTQPEYDALPSKNASTIYFIKE